jgi:plasmid maintenance system killer protein
VHQSLGCDHPVEQLPPRVASACDNGPIGLRRKLLAIDVTSLLDDLRIPPGNRLEALRGDRQGQFSSRVNDQWRICFVWRNNEACDVEIVDYH